jgi:hypothetical protein
MGRRLPDPSARQAFTAAMLAVTRVLSEHGYPLGAIAELELLDVEFRARSEALGGGRED